MKKYFVYNGSTHTGPFSLEDLQAMVIVRETPVWYEGLQDWTTAGEIPELNMLFKAIPPPYKKPDESVEPVIKPPVYNTGMQEAGKQEKNGQSIPPFKKSDADGKAETIVITIILSLAVAVLQYYFEEYNNTYRPFPGENNPYVKGYFGVFIWYIIMQWKTWSGFQHYLKSWNETKAANATTGYLVAIVLMDIVSALADSGPLNTLSIVVSAAGFIYTIIYGIILITVNNKQLHLIKELGISILIAIPIVIILTLFLSGEDIPVLPVMLLNTAIMNIPLVVLAVMYNRVKKGT